MLRVNCCLRRGGGGSPAPSSRRGFRRLQPTRARALLAVAGCVAALTAGQLGSAEFAPYPGKVLLISGLMSFFSTGLDKLGEELTARGYNAEVVPTGLAYHAVDHVGNQYAVGQIHGPLVLIGHSLGADLLPDLAGRLAARNRSVDLIVPIDATFPSDVPANVRRCVNIYQTGSTPSWFPIYRGVPMKAKSPATELINMDVHGLPDRDAFAHVNHFTIDESPQVHALIIAEVARLMQGAVAVPQTRTTFHLPAVSESPEVIPAPGGRLPSNR